MSSDACTTLLACLTRNSALSALALASSSATSVVACPSAVSTRLAALALHCNVDLAALAALCARTPTLRAVALGAARVRDRRYDSGARRTRARARFVFRFVFLLLTRRRRCAQCRRATRSRC